MKKCIFAIMLFLGSLLFGFNNEVNLVEAGNSQPEEIFVADAYDKRKLTITVEDVPNQAILAKVYEVRQCAPSDSSCIQLGHIKVEVFDMVEYTVSVGESKIVKLDYRIVTENDGKKTIMVVFYESRENENSCRTVMFDYELSTIGDRIVLNPDGNGKPLHRYDGVEYTSVRNLPISINLTQEEKEKYSGIVYICEEGSSPIEFDIYKEKLNVSLLSYGDGTKVIKFYFVKSNVTPPTYTENLESFLATGAEEVVKNIYLDTVGPKIYVKGEDENWVWVYLEAGKTYRDQQPICIDAVFSEDSCNVKNDLDVVSIKYDTENYQFVTYEASDRLGNVTMVTAKIKVEIIDTTERDNWILGLAISGGVMLVVFIVLGYILIKNHEKKKKISYI